MAVTTSGVYGNPLHPPRMMNPGHGLYPDYGLWGNRGGWILSSEALAMIIGCLDWTYRRSAGGPWFCVLVPDTHIGSSKTIDSLGLALLADRFGICTFIMSGSSNQTVLCYENSRGLEFNAIRVKITSFGPK